MSFEKFGLSPELLNGLADVRLEKPTPLQEKVLPVVLEGKHVLIQTHTHDDLAFLIPALQKITGNGQGKGTQVLILTPSIERAEHIDEQIWALGYHAQISSALMAMKGDKSAQEQVLMNGAPVIVANPGRYIDILDKNNFRLKNLKLIVIDEAHEMQQYNLVNRIEEILRFVDCEPQIIILSSVQNSATKKLVDIALKNPELIGFEVNNDSSSSTKDYEFQNDKSTIIDQDHIEKKLKKISVSVVLKKEVLEHKSTISQECSSSDHGIIKAPPRMKISTLIAYLEQSEAKHIAVFCASPRTSDRLFKIIRKKNWGVVSLGNDLEESVYLERLERYNKYDMRILLIGGISVNDIDHTNISEIINYDVPSETIEYMSRAKLLMDGSVERILSLVSKMDMAAIDNISSEMGISIAELPIKKLPIEKKQKVNTEESVIIPSTKEIKRKESKLRGTHPKKNNKKKIRKSLPRPKYDKLSGGRDGIDSNSGIFGWIKKLFK